MNIDVRPSQDAGKYLATDQLVWFGEVSDSDAEHLRLGLPEDQRFVVDLSDGPPDLHSGVYGVRPLDLSLPGGCVVPIAGLTWVGVHPDVRRRGVLAAMMTEDMGLEALGPKLSGDEVYAGGEPYSFEGEASQVCRRAGVEVDRSEARLVLSKHVGVEWE